MQRRIAYDDRHLGELLVPRRTRTFCSDLTSVPTLLTWLVPKTGEHLPATLLHDGLIHPAGEPTYTSANGHVVQRVQANRVLRDAMADAGTALIRRVADLVGRGDGDDARRQWNGLVERAQVVLPPGCRRDTFAGLRARRLRVLDLFDADIPALPWMGDRPWFVEVVGGLSGAVVIPLVLALFWGRFRIAGAVVGVSLAVLLPVTVALLVPTVIYQLLELTAKAPKVARGLAFALGAAALVVWLALSLRQL